jgi:uridine kinase
MNDLRLCEEIFSRIVAWRLEVAPPLRFARGIRVVVAISGGSALGKSFFGQTFAQWLRSKEISCAHVELDGFLCDRKARRQLGISGYDPAATQFAALREVLDRMVFAGESVKLPWYNHEVGRVTRMVSRELSQVILLDGTVAMNPVIGQRYATAQVFFYAPSAARRTLRERVDREKRGHTTASAADDPAEERDYLRWIESQAGEADLIVRVKSHGTYEFGCD